MEGFLRYRFGGLIHGGAYFRNFMVFMSIREPVCTSSKYVQGYICQK